MSQQGDPRVGLTLREQLVEVTNNPERMCRLASVVAQADDEDAITEMAINLAQVIRSSAVYYATPEVTYALSETAKRLKPEHLVRFYREDFPVQSGLMVFDGSGYTMPNWGSKEPQLLRAILWVVQAQGLILWTLVSDETDRSEWMRDHAVGGMHFRQMLGAPWGRLIKIDDDPSVPTSDVQSGFFRGTTDENGVVHIGANDINTYRDETVERYRGAYVPDLTPEDEQREAALAVAATFRLLYTWVQFVADEIVRPERVPLGRAERRRHERAKLPEPSLNILLLRRVRHDKPSGEEPREIDYSHRWLVSGHWRNQPYGPRDNPEYRAKFIHGYVKGPEDKPLVVKDRVVVLGR